MLTTSFTPDSQRLPFKLLCDPSTVMLIRQNRSISQPPFEKIVNEVHVGS